MALVIDYSSGIFEAAPSGETVGTVTGNATLDLTSGNLFNHTPTANTTFVFSNPPTTGSAYDMTLKVVGANVTAGYDLANASYDSVSFSVGTEETIPSGIFFKPDGTKFYISGVIGDDITQYSLSTAWDITTSAFETGKILDVSSQDTTADGLFFKPDGLTLYVAGSETDAIYQYTLTTAWDISTASYASRSMDVSGEETTVKCIFFKPDGTKAYIAGNISDKVHQYALTTAWDVSTGSKETGKEFSISSQEGTVQEIFFKPDGTKLYIVGSNNDTVYQYSLSTAWDVSTASYDSVSFSVSSQESIPRGLYFKDDGSKMYIVGPGSDTVFQYSTSSSALATLTYPSSVKWAGGTAPSAPANGEKDVYNFFTLDGGTTYYGFQAGDAMA